MRQFAGFLVLFTALTACSPSSQTSAERRAEAARADSSAAGYDVGPRPPGSGVASASKVDSTSDSTKRASATTATGAAGRGNVVVPQPIATVPRVATQPVQRPAVTVVDSARGQSGRGGLRSGGLPPMDPAVEATFLVFDTAKKAATFQLAAGNEIVNQVSFNGAWRGRRILTVPVGWRLGIEFTNRDAELPHSATIVAGFEPIPEQLPPPAFPHAQTVKVEEGLLEGDSDEIIFIADRAGRYLIACGVLGHAQRGQWIVLEVSATATVPTYR